MPGEFDADRAFYDVRTSSTLLSGLRESEDHVRFEESWSRFYLRYAPQICRWAERAGLCRADAEEITADLIARLLTAMKQFRYDPTGSFRAWLYRVTHNAMTDFWRARARVTTNHERFDELLSRDAMRDCLDSISHREILALAQEEVALAAGQRNWEIYAMMTEMDIPASQIAAEYGLSRDAVYKIRARVRQQLAQTLKSLDDGIDSD